VSGWSKTVRLCLILLIIEAPLLVWALMRHWCQRPVLWNWRCWHSSP